MINIKDENFDVYGQNGASKRKFISFRGVCKIVFLVKFNNKNLFIT